MILVIYSLRNQFFMLKKFKNIKDDLHINRGVIVVVTRPNIEIEDIYKIDISSYVVPKEECESEEYEEQVKNIKRYINRTLKRYVMGNSNIFCDNSIVDVNFTSANLRKGYNKSVQVSMFVKSKNKFEYSRFRDRIKNTIKPTIKMITDRFILEGYQCHKRKQKINKKHGNDI